jgi:hypothetical protein
MSSDSLNSLEDIKEYEPETTVNPGALSRLFEIRNRIETSIPVLSCLEFIDNWDLLIWYL